MMISDVMISNVVTSRISDIEDGKHVTSKGGDVGDDGGMTCGVVDEGGVEASSENGGT